MEPTIFAATGGVGGHVLEQAIAAGNDVTAVVRNPKALSCPVRVVAAADLAAPDAATLESAVAGADAVLSGLGPRNGAEYGIVSLGHQGDRRGDEDDRCTAHRHGQRRRYRHDPHSWPPERDPGAGVFLRYLINPLSTLVYGKHYVDVALMEDILRGSRLGWTAVGVPVLTDKPLPHLVRAERPGRLADRPRRRRPAHAPRPRLARDHRTIHRHRVLTREGSHHGACHVNAPSRTRNCRHA